ncbi:RNA polymerase sigma factor [Paenibacillus spongiae]|uniref:RNA polymerase sigma factor n=1 Tax=Paenibacillus spongiae TaxID=2909671 RepID=A0ABY5SFG2_9BACL|nr:RNA polymerase sigma factor [Paenibacillus spongiae]UVI32671.1 RNA polymerase sigma factor [Paenibacillus spongiae]
MLELKPEESHWKHLTNLDAGLLRSLMEQYGQDVWSLAYILTKRHDLADDVAQDVFLNAYRNIQSFRGESAIKTWLLSMTRNTAINYTRTAFMRRVTLTAWITSKATSPSAEHEAMELELSDDIWRTVLKLPLKFREVLILHGKYDLSVKEIAETLGISEGTVKSRLSRARHKVSAYWKEETAYERL